MAARHSERVKNPFPLAECGKRIAPAHDWRCRLKLQLSEQHRSEVERVHLELTKAVADFDQRKAARDALVELGATARAAIAELHQTGTPQADADVLKMVLARAREDWAVLALNPAQLAMNVSGETVCVLLHGDVSTCFTSALSPVLSGTIEEINHRLTPLVGDHAGRAAAADAEPVRRLRNFLTLRFVTATPAMGHAALDWLDSLLDGELPAPARAEEPVPSA